MGFAINSHLKITIPKSHYIHVTQFERLRRISSSSSGSNSAIYIFYDDEEHCSIDNLDLCIDNEERQQETETENANLGVDDDDKIVIQNLPTYLDDELLIEDIPDELWDSDNLEATLDCDLLYPDECCIDNLDACVKENTTETSSSSKSSSSSQQALRRFLANPLVEVQLSLLVLVSSFFVGLGTLHSLPPAVANIEKYGELLVLFVFSLEFILRWKLEEFSVKYIFKPGSIIDLIAILPGLINIVAALGLTAAPEYFLGGALINLRLLRLLRLQLVLKDYETFRKFEMALGLDPSNIRLWQLQLARVIISIFTLLSVTAGLIYSAEHNVNPNITDYFTSLYFSLITLTTVGFGDLYPVTTAGKWILSGSILVGSVVIPAQAAALVEALLNRDGEQQVSNSSGVNGDKELLESSLEILTKRLDRLEDKINTSNDQIERLLLKILQDDDEKTLNSGRNTTR